MTAEQTFDIPVADILDRLTGLAVELGAGQAAAVDPAGIPIEDHLAGLCKTPGCPNYGRARSCPPHVPGPEAMRGWLARAEAAVAFKIDVPSELMMSEEMAEVMALLHHIAAGVEAAAKGLGFGEARGFAGGSCRRLFCRDEKSCRVVDEGGDCRHPDIARPSMSGFGVDVGQMMAAAGLAMSGRAAGNQADDDGKSISLAAMVLLGRKD